MTTKKEEVEIKFIHAMSEDIVKGIENLTKEDLGYFIDYVVIQIDKRFDEIEFTVKKLDENR